MEEMDFKCTQPGEPSVSYTQEFLKFIIEPLIGLDQSENALNLLIEEHVFVLEATRLARLMNDPRDWIQIDKTIEERLPTLLEKNKNNFFLQNIGNPLKELVENKRGAPAEVQSALRVILFSHLMSLNHHIKLDGIPCNLQPTQPFIKNTLNVFDRYFLPRSNQKRKIRLKMHAFLKNVYFPLWYLTENDSPLIINNALKLLLRSYFFFIDINKTVKIGISNVTISRDILNIKRLNKMEFSGLARKDSFLCNIFYPLKSSYEKKPESISKMSLNFLLEAHFMSIDFVIHVHNVVSQSRKSPLQPIDVDDSVVDTDDSYYDGISDISNDSPPSEGSCIYVEDSQSYDGIIQNAIPQRQNIEENVPPLVENQDMTGDLLEPPIIYDSTVVDYTPTQFLLRSIGQIEIMDDDDDIPELVYLGPNRWHIRGSSRGWGGGEERPPNN